MLGTADTDYQWPHGPIPVNSTMRVLLDNKPCTLSAENLGEVLDAANDIAQGRGRLVVEVMVDGIALNETQLLDSSRLQARAEEVRLRTCTAMDILSETFANAAEAVIEVQKVQEHAAKLIQGGKLVEGMKTLSMALATWIEVHDAVVKGLSLAGEDAENLVIEGIRFNNASSGLQGLLAELRTGIANSDSSAICDCLLYEFPAICTDWAGLLQGLSQSYDSKGTDVDEMES